MIKANTATLNLIMWIRYFIFTCLGISFQICFCFGTETSFSHYLRSIATGWMVLHSKECYQCAHKGSLKFYLGRLVLYYPHDPMRSYNFGWSLKSKKSMMLHRQNSKCDRHSLKAQETGLGGKRRKFTWTNK